MSIIDETLKITLNAKGAPTNSKSLYKPTAEEKEAISFIKKCFTLGDVTMRKPRRVFNDLSVLDRMSVDKMAWNTYQPNDGNGIEGDEINSWKSNAMKPIVRNKIVSIAAHATARTIFPKIFAYSKDNEEQADAATVMRDLMEWVADKSDYSQTSFYAIISALVNPVSIINLDYVEAYKASKTEKGADGKWITKYVEDEDASGFKDIITSADELYIENFYEHDIQKQGWLIMRKVQSYELLKTKYCELYPNFEKYVKPGMQLIYNDANQSFYEVYDATLGQEMGEEIILWHKGLDLKLIAVNGVLLTTSDNPNPRMDKQYPFVKFGYELIDEGKCFYYKSLAFKMKQDANIINSLYPMVIDGTYLSVFPPIKVTGAEAISSDVIIPGAAITLSSSDASLEPISVGQNINQGLQMLTTVEESIANSSQDPILSGQQEGGTQTAYEISKIEANANTVLGLFIKMISFYVKQYGKLRVNDILQYLTLPDTKNITGGKLAYKTFLLADRNANGKNLSRKIVMDGEMSDEEISGEESIEASYKIMKEEKAKGIQLYKVNPRLIRTLKYELKVSPDVLQPNSEELERAYALEEYDRMIANPLANQEEAFKILLSVYPKTKGDVEKYIIKQQPMMPNTPNLVTGQAVDSGIGGLQTANLNKTI